ncbi:putative DNA polymerase [Aeromonas phage LAh10]|uniref:Putative DNA polymerase n=1 Tax=Aeromonas phage LAh10 TaxID=2591025 RepID=A0A514A183_9CAUD|nr:putative DNA polymerase [Aeromonas phage LAh10]QDH47034.1 putative DNA polymerase [Aeromonas phage LAh10]
MLTTKPKVIARVCKHAYLSYHKNDPDHDLLTAKITEIDEEGGRTDRLVFLEDYKTDFYVVKPNYRTFKDNRDYIEIKKCDKFSSNAARLHVNISKVLHGRPDRKADITMLKNNPFVFGCQETVPVIFKQKFFDKYPDHQPQEAYSVAAYDVETFILDDGSTGPINMASTTIKNKVYWCGLREIFHGHDDETIMKNLKLYEKQYLQEYIDKHNVEIVYELADRPGVIVYNNIQWWHKVGPDFIVSWNANFDMEANQEALLNEGYDLAMTYSDPDCPRAYQDYLYYPGRQFKTKVDGSKSPLDNHEKFPVVQAPAKWQWFDGMSFYAIKRAPGGKRESYSLQFTAESEGIEGKLYTEKGSHLQAGSAEWHKWMLKHEPYLYAMYNIRDNWTIEDLNRATNDYSLSLPSLVTSSELRSYQSQPSMISDKLSFIAKQNGYVWGTVGRRKEDPFKELKPDLRDWIALLHAELNEANGRALYTGLQDWKSMGRGSTDDIDVTGAYPHVTVALNVSNKTTKLEVCEVQGLDRLDYRRLGVNYASSPIANANTLCTTIFGMPSLVEANDFYASRVMPFIEEQKQKEAA